MKIHKAIINTYESFDQWFDEHVEPINKMLSEGVEVYTSANRAGYHVDKDLLPEFRTHTALLINIQPIKKETAEDVLREFLLAAEDHDSTVTVDLYDRAKAVLGES